ncbi:unnamed protein product, partial [Timema podura]|nr:unnamed protein product [Timema podura]
MSCRLTVTDLTLTCDKDCTMGPLNAESGGWGCTDDSEATPESRLLLTTLLLTLSNIFFLPAILVALQHRLFTEAIVLQFCDFFCSILAFWVTLIAIAGIPPQITSSLHMVGVFIISVGVEYNRTGLLVFIIPFCLGIFIPV